jgi:hypothetical protein
MKIITIVVRNPKRIRPQHIAEVVMISNKLVHALKARTQYDCLLEWEDQGRLCGDQGTEVCGVLQQRDSWDGAPKARNKDSNQEAEPSSWRIWELASKILATRACGEVDVVLGKIVRPRKRLDEDRKADIDEESGRLPKSPNISSRKTEQQSQRLTSNGKTALRFSDIQSKLKLKANEHSFVTEQEMKIELT